MGLKDCTVTRFFAPKPTTPTMPTPPAPGDASRANDAVPSNAQVSIQQAFPAWPLGIPLSMHVYLTTNTYGNVFSGSELDTLPHFVWRNITFGDWSDTRTIEYDINLPSVRFM